MHSGNFAYKSSSLLYQICSTFYSYTYSAMILYNYLYAANGDDYLSSDLRQCFVQYFQDKKFILLVAPLPYRQSYFSGHCFEVFFHTDLPEASIT